MRRAFLCGRDEHSGNDYEHRRGWIEQRLLQLAGVYALDICAYTVMSNHYHVVQHINAEKAKAWSDSEVIRRWHTLYAGNFLNHEYLAGKDLYEEQLKFIAERVEEWRDRLMSISRFMRALNEDIARQVNAEDGYAKWSPITAIASTYDHYYFDSRLSCISYLSIKSMTLTPLIRVT